MGRLRLNIIRRLGWLRLNIIRRLGWLRLSIKVKDSAASP